MKLSEKLYQLRRQAGLSQEQAAEQLGVSRQSVSKWEGGQSVPEADKLAAISRLYGVTTDYLLLEDAPLQARTPAGNRSLIPGLILCLAGVAGLLLFGLVVLFAPDTAARMDVSSAVTIQGSGLWALGCLLVLAVGSWLLLRKTR